jgi:DNA-binding GntR family transcriptional regulator
MRATKATPKQRTEPVDDRPDRIYNELRELIVSGRLGPGTRLVETTVAGRLGVSRTPVRSALHRLLREGYAVSVNEDDERQRLAVAPMTAADAADLFYIVGELEGLAGLYAAGRERGSRKEMVEEMDRLNGELQAESQAGSPDAFRAFRLDNLFHRQYVVDAAPPRLRALHDAIKPQAERYARLYATALTRELGVSAAEHEEIVRAIAAGDAETAQRAIQTNWRNAARRIESVINLWGESGGW